MTRARAEQLARRRVALRRRSRDLRQRAGIHAHALQPVLGWAERAHSAWLWLRQRPPELVWPLAVVTGLWVARRPGRLVSAPLRLWSVWRLWQRFTAQRRG
jgi:hypothetical protein